MRRNIVIQALIGICGLAGLCVAPASADNGPLVRIAVAQNIERVTIRISGAYEMLDPRSRRVFEQGMGFNAVITKSGRGGLNVAARPLVEQRVRFSSARDIGVVVDDKERRYRGFVDVIVAANGKLLVVNTLDIEDYIKGVLYHEVSNRWPMEALKTQAVASRSYAVTQVLASAKRDFDVTNDIYSQVYGGRTSERYRTNLAVDATKGEILVEDGKVLPAYFHATCGGRTENSSALWPRQSWAALQGVRCVSCRESPHYFWKRNIRLKDIQDKLNAKGHAIGLIEDIGIAQRNSSERIGLLIITDRTGRQLRISGKDFREIVGPNLIRSNNYFVVMQGYYADFIGKGWGHGVGMCQWGANGMSERGIGYDEILTHYYPSAKIMKLRSSDPSRIF